MDEITWGITNREGFGIFINRKKGRNEYGLGLEAYVIKKCLASNPTPDQSFISTKDNLSSKNFSDGRDKFEALLFGKRFKLLFIGGNHFLFDVKNWNNSLEDFKRKFKLNNVKKTPAKLKEELNELKKYDNVKILFENVNYDNLPNNTKKNNIRIRSNGEADPQVLNTARRR